MPVMMRTKALVDAAERLDSFYRELETISGEVRGVSRRLGQSSGMDVVRQRLHQRSVSMENAGVLARGYGRTLLQIAQWQESCESRIQDRYDEATVRFARREAAVIDVSFISGILR